MIKKKQKNTEHTVSQRGVKSCIMKKMPSFKQLIWISMVQVGHKSINCFIMYNYTY